MLNKQNFCIFIFVKRKYNEMERKRRVMVRMSEEEKIAFDIYCKKNGYSISKRVRILIQKDLNGEIK